MDAGQYRLAGRVDADELRREAAVRFDVVRQGACEPDLGHGNGSRPGIVGHRQRPSVEAARAGSVEGQESLVRARAHVDTARGHPQIGSDEVLAWDVGRRTKMDLGERELAAQARIEALGRRGYGGDEHDRGENAVPEPGHGTNGARTDHGSPPDGWVTYLASIRQASQQRHRARRRGAESPCNSPRN